MGILFPSVLESIAYKSCFARGEEFPVAMQSYFHPLISSASNRLFSVITPSPFSFLFSLFFSFYDFVISPCSVIGRIESLFLFAASGP